MLVVAQSPRSAKTEARTSAAAKTSCPIHAWPKDVSVSTVATISGLVAALQSSAIDAASSESQTIAERSATTLAPIVSRLMAGESARRRLPGA